MVASIRNARPEELEGLLSMHKRSMRALSVGRYTPATVEAALTHMGTMDPKLIADGTYLVAEHGGELAGSAGWTMRQPNYAKLLQEALPPLPGRVGVVRSVYVEPRMARRGVARHLMAAVESRLALEGAETAELMATLCGVPLYESMGYVPLSDHALLLADGSEFVVRRMIRALEPMRQAA
jgi:GNAT superfamily N-acetyltransferase